MIQIQVNGKKPHFGPELGPLNPNSGRQFFFFKNLASSVTKYHGQVLTYKMLEKTNDPILRKSSKGWTDDKQADRQIDRRTRVIP